MDTTVNIVMVVLLTFLWIVTPYKYCRGTFYKYQNLTIHIKHFYCCQNRMGYNFINIYNV